MNVSLVFLAHFLCLSISLKSPKSNGYLAVNVNFGNNKTLFKGGVPHGQHLSSIYLSTKYCLWPAMVKNWLFQPKLQADGIMLHAGVLYNVADQGNWRHTGPCNDVTCDGIFDCDVTSWRSMQRLVPQNVLFMLIGSFDFNCASPGQQTRAGRSSRGGGKNGLLSRTHTSWTRMRTGRTIPTEIKYSYFL